MSAYYITPPKLKTYSPFFRATAVRKATMIVEWADAEYKKALLEASKHGRYRVHHILTNEWSGMRVLSLVEDFRWFCAMMYQNPDIWNQLDRKTRKFITKSYELHELLRH